MTVLTASKEPAHQDQVFLVVLFELRVLCTHHALAHTPVQLRRVKLRGRCYSGSGSGWLDEDVRHGGTSTGWWCRIEVSVANAAAAASLPVAVVVIVAVGGKGRIIALRAERVLAPSNEAMPYR